jgi:hypothetical protein
MSLWRVFHGQFIETDAQDSCQAPFSIDIVIRVFGATKQLQKVTIEHGQCDHASMNTIVKRLQVTHITYILSDSRNQRRHGIGSMFRRGCVS